MQKEDWVAKNWAFLSQRQVIEIPTHQTRRFFQNSQVSTSAKFYGTTRFYQQNSFYGVVTAKGTRRLYLRPYIIAPMAKNWIQAVYIDPKKYTFDEQGNITGLESLYEAPIFVFVDTALQEQAREEQETERGDM